MAYVLSERPVLYCKLSRKNTTVVSNCLPKKTIEPCHATTCGVLKGRYGFSVGVFPNALLGGFLQQPTFTNSPTHPHGWAVARPIRKAIHINLEA